MKRLSAKWWPICLGLNVLMPSYACEEQTQQWQTTNNIRQSMYDMCNVSRTLTKFLLFVTLCHFSLVFPSLHLGNYAGGYLNVLLQRDIATNVPLVASYLTLILNTSSDLWYFDLLYCTGENISWHCSKSVISLLIWFGKVITKMVWPWWFWVYYGSIGQKTHTYEYIYMDYILGNIYIYIPLDIQIC